MVTKHELEHHTVTNMYKKRPETSKLWLWSLGIYVRNLKEVLGR